MSGAEQADPGPSKRYPLGGVRLAALWLVLTLGLLPAMKLLMATEHEVSSYHTFTFESHVREALAQAQYDHAVRIATGALRTGLERSDHWGLAHLLRAKAHAAAGRLSDAVADLRATAQCWTSEYYYPSPEQRREAEDFGTKLGTQLLESGHVEAARQAVSAAGVSSGRPVEYLHEQWQSLAPEQSNALWPDGPFLTLVLFEGARRVAFQPWVEERGRELVEAGVDPTGSRSGGPCGILEVGDPTQDGRSWYALPLYIPISPKPFALRLAMKERRPSEVAVLVGHWFELARKSVVTFDTESTDLGRGWRLYDIRRDFHAERAAQAAQEDYDPVGGLITHIGFDVSEAPANRWWVDGVELYIPDAAAP